MSNFKCDSPDISPLPFAGLSRQIHMISRMEELGSLPEVLAKQCRTLLENEVRPAFLKLAPHLPDALEVVNEPPV